MIAKSASAQLKLRRLYITLSNAHHLKFGNLGNYNYIFAVNPIFQSILIKFYLRIVIIAQIAVAVTVMLIGFVVFGALDGKLN